MPEAAAARRHGVAWIALALAIGLHVADEAAHDFLSVYNPAAEAMREEFPVLPMPTFTFETWIMGLTAAVILLLAVAPFVFIGAQLMRPLSYVVAGLMIANALGHVASSLYTGRLMPGVYSSPVLLAAAVWLFLTARRTSRS